VVPLKVAENEIGIDELFFIYKTATKQAVSSLKISGFEFDQESKEMWDKLENNIITTEDISQYIKGRTSPKIHQTR